MARRKVQVDRMAWIKAIIAILFACCLSLSYYLVWRLPPRSPDPELRPQPSVEPGNVSVESVEQSYFNLQPGLAPTLGSLSFKGRQLQSRKLDLELVAVESGKEYLPCHLKAMQSKNWQLDCGGILAEVSATPYQMRDALALRWHVIFQSPVKKLRISAWLPSAAVEGHVDGSPVVARRRPAISRFSGKCSASSSFPGRGPARLLDDDRETEWFAAKGQSNAWILMDLEGDKMITSVSWIWWAKSMADEWVLESRADGEDSWVRRSGHQDVSVSSDFNAAVSVKGWATKSRWIRLTMGKGHLDPWNFGVLFGLRSFHVSGRDDASTVGTAAAWGNPVTSPAGLWLALEHPRSHCHVDQRPKDEVWRWATCTLRLSEKPMGRSHIFASLGIFEDGQQSQMRRSFGEYLQLARARPFGQVLHYNSWYDLRNPSCSDAKCFSHPMTERSCLDRLQAFNGNLTRWEGHALDAFLLDDGWDNADSLWEVDTNNFPKGFDPLVAEAKRSGTKMGVWMSPFGGYGAAGGRRIHYGAAHGFERSGRGGFALAGPKYFQSFFSVVQRRIAEGFGIFKFDGLGGGLGQSGGEEHLDDFEAMLHLIEELRHDGSRQPWISLTIGTWPSPFWLLWADSIWRDGPDVGAEGHGPVRDKWLTFRDNALRRAQTRGPLFPLTAFMQHGVVLSKTAETIEMWSQSQPKPTLKDFCHEVLSFFLAGTGLQELYIQTELMDDDLWRALAAASQLARQEANILADSRLVTFGGSYGAAALEILQDGPAGARGIFWLRNPGETTSTVTFSISEMLELPDSLQKSHWQLTPLLLEGCPTPSPQVQKTEISSSELLTQLQPPFAVHAWIATRISATVAQLTWLGSSEKGWNVCLLVLWMHVNALLAVVQSRPCSVKNARDPAACMEPGYPTLEQMNNTGGVQQK